MHAQNPQSFSQIQVIEEVKRGESGSQSERQLKGGKNALGSSSYCLLANDCPFLLQAYSQTLKKHFDHVVTAENGFEAVNIVKSHDKAHFTAIILDNEMPFMNGMEACTRIQQHLQEEEKSAVLNAAVDLNRELSQSLVSFGRVGEDMGSSEGKRIPFVYALTQDVSDETFKQLKRVGFKEICK